MNESTEITCHSWIVSGDFLIYQVTWAGFPGNIGFLLIHLPQEKKHKEHVLITQAMWQMSNWLLVEERENSERTKMEIDSKN